MKNKTDEELVKAYMQGQEEAFNEIHTRYKNAILYYAHSVYCIGASLEDVIQEGMLGLLNAVRYYNGKSSFKNYAFLCIKSSILKAVTRKFSPLNTSIDIDECEIEINRIAINPEDEIEIKETIRVLLEELNKKLSPLEQNVLELYLQDYTYAEIGEKLGCSAKKCDNVLQKIRKKLSE